MDLSIIVPIYNVEEYVRPCMESLFRQGLDEECFEIIAVNDGSTDNSIKVIEDLVEKHHNISIINQSNQGLSVARNTGIAKSSGTYILFVDSDDLLIDNTLSALLQEALKSRPDMLVADYVKMDNQQIESRKFPSSDCTFQSTTGTELFLHQLDPRACYVTNKLYNRAFLNKNHLCFTPGIYFEDIPFTTACYLNAGSCIKSNCSFYIYRQRLSSICSSINIQKIFDLNTVLALLKDIIASKPDLQDSQRLQVEEVMFATFSIALWYTVSDLQLFEQRKVIIKDLQGKVPDLYFSNTIKQRIVSMVFRAMPNTYLYIRRLLGRLTKSFK
jgi:glycosyltransferase involved in cell wall biosynthesis